MPDPETQPRSISPASTKKEMLEAYQELLKQLEEKREAELQPEKRIEEKERRRAVAAADSISPESVAGAAVSLKGEVGKVLAQLQERLEAEIARYRDIKKAVEVKEQELAEIYDIQKSAATLAALIEAQNRRKAEFEAQMAARKEALETEIKAGRDEWEKEKKLREVELKERELQEKKRRERELEEYQYAFNREKQLAKDRHADETEGQQRELALRREQAEKELAERESLVARREQELADLQGQVAGFPKELDGTVARAVKEATDRLRQETGNREELLKREFEGERNVLNARIQALEKTVKEQSERMARLSQQLEKAYQQIQDIAVKTVEGASRSKVLDTLEQLTAEQAKRPAPER